MPCRNRSESSRHSCDTIVLAQATLATAHRCQLEREITQISEMRNNSCSSTQSFTPGSIATEVLANSKCVQEATRYYRGRYMSAILYERTSRLDEPVHQNKLAYEACTQRRALGNNTHSTGVQIEPVPDPNTHPILPADRDMRGCSGRRSGSSGSECSESGKSNSIRRYRLYEPLIASVVRRYANVRDFVFFTTTTGFVLLSDPRSRVLCVKHIPNNEDSITNN